MGDVVTKSHVDYRRLVELSKVSPDRDDHLTTLEVATILKVGPETVRRRIADGSLPAIRIGDSSFGSFRVRRSDLNRYLMNLRVD